MTAFMNNFARIDWVDEQIRPPQMECQVQGNQRLLPTDEHLKDKRFSIGVWCYLQYVSKCNHIDGFRYVAIEDLSKKRIDATIMKMSKDKTSNSYFMKKVSMKMITNALDYFTEIGLITGVVDAHEVFENYKGKFYRLKNQDAFTYYTLFENRFIQYLIATIPQEAIKVYWSYVNILDTKSQFFYAALLASNSH